LPNGKWSHEKCKLVTILDETVARRAAYYEATADSYNAAHVERERIVALYLLAGYINWPP
jgi:hypothetical protein